jgi:hypothetical protein
MKIFYTQFKIVKINFDHKSHTQANGSFAHCQHDLKFLYAVLHPVNVWSPKWSHSDLVEFGLHGYLQIYGINKVIWW